MGVVRGLPVSGEGHPVCCVPVLCRVSLCCVGCRGSRIAHKFCLRMVRKIQVAGFYAQEGAHNGKVTFRSANGTNVMYWPRPQSLSALTVFRASRMPALFPAVSGRTSQFSGIAHSAHCNFGAQRSCILFVRIS